ncbi:MAG: hypothetical protein IJ488_01760 [Clostridia bacterium]|nr:hypothetical protein [Clostridia bacterium]
MKKILTLLALLLALSFALVSCKIGDGGADDGSGENSGSSDSGNAGNSDNSGNGSSSGTQTVSLSVCYSPEISVSDREKYNNAIQAETGINPTVISDPKNICTGTVLIGDCKTTVTDNASRRLLRSVTADTEICHWLLYTDGSSVAIAYDNEFAIEEALDEVLSRYTSGGLFDGRSGTVKLGEFKALDFLDAKRDELREEYYAEMSKILDEDTMNSVRALYDLYGSEIFIWWANLYDPDIGGFYFSNSARDNIGFLPDIESTVQLLNGMQSSKLLSAYGNSYANALPDDIKEKLIAFAQGLQSPDDGYFYHPQWGTDIINARRGRDCNWATQMLTRLGEKPLYDAADGTKGYSRLNGSADAGVEAVSLRGRVSGKGAEYAAAILVSSSGKNLPEYLRSLSAWKKYLEDLKFEVDSYTAGNDIAAQYKTIKMAGEEFVDYTFKFLAEKQNPETGLWESERVDGDSTKLLSYNATNGLFKIAHFYYYFGETFPNAEAAFRSNINIILQEEGATHVCSVYNPWATFNLLFESIEKSDGAERVKELRQIVLDNAEPLVRITLKKISRHKMSDGGFAYRGDVPQLTSQKALVACASTPESDLNATEISMVGLANAMCESLGFADIPIFSAYDGEYYLDLLTSMGTIIKNEVVSPDPETFDTYNKSDGNEQYGLTLSPATTVTTECADTTYVDGVHKYYSSSVVDDPKAELPGDKALKITSYYGSQDDRSSKVMYSFYEIQNQAVIGNCYKFSVDLMFNKADGANFMQLLFCRTMGAAYDTVGFDFTVYTAGDGEQYIRLGDYRVGLDGDSDTNLKDGLALGEWHNFYFEMYKIYEPGENGKQQLSVITKVWVNGEYVGISDSTRIESGAIVETAIGAVSFSHSRGRNVEMYVDNVVGERTKDIYKAESPLFPVAPENIPESVPTLSGEHIGGEFYNNLSSAGKRYGYDNGEKAPAAKNGVEAKTFVTEEKYVYYWRNGATSHENLYYNFPTPPDYLNLVNVLEADIAVGGVEKNSVVMMQIFGSGMRAKLLLNASSDGKTVTFANASVKNPSATLQQDTWYNVRIEMYVRSTSDIRFKVFVNGEFAAELAGQDVLTDSSNRYMLELQLTSAESDSYVAFDNLYLGFADISYAPGESQGQTGGDKYSCTGTTGNGKYFSDSEATGTKYDFSSGDFVSTVAPNANYNDKAYITDEGYVRFEKSGDTPAQNTAIEYHFGATPDSATMTVVEFDAAFGGLTNDVTVMRLILGNGKNRANFYIMTDVYGNLLMKGNSFGMGSTFKIPKREWHNFRFEYYVTEESVLIAKMYIDNVWQADVIGESTVQDHITDSRVCLFLQSPSPATWMNIDNIYLGYSSEEIVNGNPDGGNDSGEDTLGIEGERGKGKYYNDYSASGTKLGFDTLGESFPTTTSPDTTEITSARYLLYKKGGTANSSMQYSFPSAISGRLGNIFEADLAFGGWSGEPQKVGRILLQSATYRADIYLATDAEGNIIISKNYDEPDVPTDTIILGKNTKIPQGEWHNWRFECYTYTEDTSKLYVKLFIDGEWQCDMVITAGAGASERTLVYIYGAAGSYIAQDNVFCGYTAEEYMIADGSVILTGTHTGGILYNDGAISGDKFSYDEEGATLPDMSSDSTVELTEEGYIIFEKSTTSNKHIEYSFPTESEGSTYVIELDLAFGGLDPSSYGYRFLLRGDGFGTNVYLKSDAQGNITLGTAAGDKTTIKSGTGVALKQDEWHNWRLEYAVDSEDQSVVIVTLYIDGVEQCKLLCEKASNTAGEQVRLFLYKGNVDSYYCLDNVYIGKGE